MLLPKADYLASFQPKMPHAEQLERLLLQHDKAVGELTSVCTLCTLCSGLEFDPPFHSRKPTNTTN